MSLLKLAAASGSDEKMYVDDVFSAYTYTGNGSTQTINNGIDVAGKGGLVWTKSRTQAVSNTLIDTTRGLSTYNFTDATDAQYTNSGVNMSVSSTGYSLNNSWSNFNQNGQNFVSWTFRKAAKFFDIVTYTGDGTSNRAIAHSLGIAPGMIIVKKTSAANNWCVYHRGIANTELLKLNLTDAKATWVGWNNTDPTSSAFTVNSGSDVNASGATYVAYLFAHDTSTDGIIQCGSFTTDGSGNATVNLGWEPQYVLYKNAGALGSWSILDTMRGYSLTNDAYLFANASSTESSSADSRYPTATGFVANGFGASNTFIYLAIRRPNKPPTTGTQVYNAIARTGTSAAATVTGVGFAPDLVWVAGRGVGIGQYESDRLRGGSQYLQGASTNTEGYSSTFITSFNMDGYSIGTFNSGSGVLTIDWNFATWQHMISDGNGLKG